MTVQLEGNYPVINRRRTGLYSLDHAVSNRGYYGYPMRTATEISGYPNSGKSTLAYYMAAKLSVTGRVVICDLEMLDRNYIINTFEAAGFDGKVKIVDSTDKKGVPISHEKMLGDMMASLREDGTGAAIWDSLAAVTPIAEASGEFGEANWGKRAKLNNQVARDIGGTLRNKPDESVMFGVNHVQQVQGGRGHTTPGGEGFKYIAALRLYIWSQETWRETSDNDSAPIGYLVGGQVEKNRYGGKGRKFQFYIVPGYGVHVGASAMFDCFEFGLAEQSTTVKIGNKSLGYIRKDLLGYAAEGKQKKFEPFLELLDKFERDKEKELKQDE